ncbi:MAG: hypothetical protein RKU31_23325 [Deltaproteobacteria bacterium]
MRTYAILIASVSVQALVLSAPAIAQDKKGLSLGQVAEAQKDPVRERLDAAKRQLESGAFDAAAVALFDYVQDEKKNTEEATYYLGKALYRLGAYHSSLHFFSTLLQAGPKSRYYKSSLEWCLFISRNLEDDRRVNDVVAKYAAGEFPDGYRDEFFFRLARYHYVQALAIERGAAVGRLGETRVEDTVTGGKSLKGDLFGEDPFEAPPPPADDPDIKKKEGGGFTIDEDLFGDPVEKPKPKKKKRKKSRKKKKATGDVELTAKEHTEASERYVLRVNETSKFGARAKFLEGLVLFKNEKENEALDAFKTVVRLTHPDAEHPNETLREAAFFQLARTHFGAQQPSFSIFYYDKVDRDSYAWLDALYEASWAEFRLGVYEKALGNLLTLHSPFFKDEYFPESHILKAVIYYENCRYPEAKNILTRFLRRYEPVLEELEAMTAREQTSDKYYEALENLRGRDLAETNTEKAEILGQVLGIALADPELQRLDEAYKEVSEEEASLASYGGGFGSAAIAERLREVLTDAKQQLAREAGRAVRNQLERERDHVKTLIQQAIRIDIETSRSEQERIESQLRDVQSRPKDIEKEFIEWTDDEKLVWPFDGEYWRDELGTYELTLAHSCR